MYVQEFIDAGESVGVDYRVFVVGDEIVACMKSYWSGLAGSLMLLKVHKSRL